MGSPKWIVEFFKKANGRCPTAEFLDSLSNEEKLFIKRSLQRLEKYGTTLERPTVAPLRDHIWELRRKTHQGNIRLLYFFFGGNKFIITCVNRSIRTRMASRKNQVKYPITKLIKR